MNNAFNRGFTILETFIVIVFIVLAMLVLTWFFYIFNGTFAVQSGLVKVSGSAATVMSELTSYVLPADSVLSTHIFTTGVYSSGVGTLVLEVPAIDSSGTVISNIYDYVAFYKSGTAVYRLLEANALSSRKSGRKQLSDTVSSLAFTYDNVDFTRVTRVDADVQTQTTVKQQVMTSHFFEELYVRNK